MDDASVSNRRSKSSYLATFRRVFLGGIDEENYLAAAESLKEY